MTRAKAAALDTEPATKAALQPKRSAANSNNAAPQRRRAALGDVSNVGKADAADGKKGASGKVGLVSKAAQPTGVQKATARPASRATVTAKKTEVKRATTTTTTSSNTLVGSQKRKTSSSLREDAQEEEAGPAKKRAHTIDAERRNRTESRAASEAETREEPPAESRITDLDIEDLDDPLMAAEYAPEIFKYLYELEEKTKPNPDYMSHQDDLEWKTRGILVDWLIEVHTRFHLLPETLFLAVNVIDRFLSEKVVQLDRLQLVGITAMFIASKYEEVLSPHVENFKRIADDGFSEAEILSAERFVLSTLDYDLSYPNPMNFLRRVSKADNYDIQSRTIGKYLMEISLLDHRFMRYSSSHVAAAAMYLSRLILDRGEWVSSPLFVTMNLRINRLTFVTRMRQLPTTPATLKKSLVMPCTSWLTTSLVLSFTKHSSRSMPARSS